MIKTEEELHEIENFKQLFREKFNKELYIKVISNLNSSKDIEREIKSYIDNYTNTFKTHFIRYGSSNYKKKGTTNVNSIYINVLRYMIYYKYNSYYKDVYLAELLDCHRTTIYNSIKCINDYIKTNDNMFINHLNIINSNNIDVDLILNKLNK